MKMENKYSPPITVCFTNTPDRPTRIAIKRSEVFIVQQFDKLQAVCVLCGDHVEQFYLNLSSHGFSMQGAMILSIF